MTEPKPKPKHPLTGLIVEDLVERVNLRLAEIGSPARVTARYRESEKPASPTTITPILRPLSRKKQSTSEDE